MKRNSPEKTSQRMNMLVFSFALLCTSSSSACAEDYIVLDGFRGLRFRHMQPEVERLRAAGHRVTYLPWWRWRSAIHSANGPVNVIGYSLGGSRASRLAHHIDVRQMELVDPVQIVGVIRLPQGHARTTVYRARMPSSIHSSVVLGSHREVLIPTDHGGMPETFYAYRPW